GPARAGEASADLELVLAVDASGSVDDAEFRLQLDGIAAAFEDPQVRAAIRSGPEGRIAVALLVWAEAEVPADASPWFVIATDADCAAFAATVRGFPRRVNGGTGIGAGLVQAMRLFERNGIAGRRQVVDVSGDGRETPPRDYVVLVDQARGMALSRGVTLNGLAILSDDPGLADWYRAEVMTGAGAFVMTASGFEDFAEAMRRKLLREVEYKPIIGLLEHARP
ncbi:MAG: DUF1194 domain-containing protein, partial [Rhodobiaceae bacterium]|nr:DUF1194 domain-containing protein [Rhodobiaceae bacterium]